MAGETRTPENDPSIDDGDFLLRKVHPSQMTRDEGVLRVSSNAFRDIRDAKTGKVAVSVFVESRLGEAGASAEDLIAEFDGFGFVAIPVAAARGQGLGITWEPNELSYGDAHAHINGHKSGSARRNLAKAARYRIWPEPPPESLE